MDQQQTIADFEARAKAIGITIGEVCSRADVHPTTFSRWKLTDKNPNPVNAGFAKIGRIRAVIEAAEAEAAQAPTERAAA